MEKWTHVKDALPRAGQRVIAAARSFVAFVLKKKYGVRGALKPPIGGRHTGPFYRLRYFAWKLTNQLYHWSGIPDQWHDYYAERINR